MRKILFFVLISVLTLTSCKKDDKKEDKCTLSEANLAGNYKVTSIKYRDSVSGPEVEIINEFLEPCQKDDVLTFNTNHTYVNTDAGTICDDNNTYDGAWSINGNAISLDGDAAVIEDFNCNRFIVSQTDVDTPGDKITITYTRQ